MSDLTGTVRLHRVLRAPPERVYRAFLDPDALVKWLPPHGFTGRVRAHGRTRRRRLPDVVHEFRHGHEPFVRRQVHRARRRTSGYGIPTRFDDPTMPGDMQVTVSLRKVACGTEVAIVQEGIPAAIPVEFCYLGWQESLSLLAHLVEPEIPDGA